MSRSTIEIVVDGKTVHEIAVDVHQAGPLRVYNCISRLPDKPVRVVSFKRTHTIGLRHLLAKVFTELTQNARS